MAQTCCCPINPCPPGSGCCPNICPSPIQVCPPSPGCSTSTYCCPTNPCTTGCGCCPNICPSPVQVCPTSAGSSTMDSQCGLPSRPFAKIPGRPCPLLTNEQACYSWRFATVDDHSFNRKTDRTNTIQCPGADNEFWNSMQDSSASVFDPHKPYRALICDPCELIVDPPPDTFDVKRRKDWIGVYIDNYMSHYHNH